jgi:hypothetical protein
MQQSTETRRITKRLIYPWMFWVKRPNCMFVKITASKYENLQSMKECYLSQGFEEIIADDYSLMRSRWRSRLYRAN